MLSKLAKLGLLILAIFLSLAIFEFLQRLFLPIPENLAKLQSSSSFLVENKPNATFDYPSSAGEFNNEIQMNSFGFRDVEFTKEKEKDVFRIAVLGDSQEEALQVPLDTTWQKIMAARLSDSGERRVETYTFAVSGYGTDQEWLTLREKVWQFSPDMVILAFSPNDVGDTYKNKLVRVKGGQIEVIGSRERAGGNWLGKVFRETYTYHLVFKVSQKWEFTRVLVEKFRAKILGFPKEERLNLSDAQLVQGPFELIASQKNPPEEVLDTWAIVKALVFDMKSQAEAHGAQFLVTVNIPRAQVQESDWQELKEQYHMPNDSSPYEINEKMAQITNDLGVNFYDDRLDANDWFRKRGILHFPHDGHFNENGHMFMGEKLAEFILAGNLIKQGQDD